MKKIALALLFVLASTLHASAQIAPDDVARIAKTIHDVEGWKLGAASSRSTRNEFWSFVIGVVHFGHPIYNATPDPSWCLKDAGNGRPQSDDVAVKCATREYWDCIGNVGADGYEDKFRCNGHNDRLDASQNVYAPPMPKGGGVTPQPQPGSRWTAQHDALLAKLGRPAGALDAGFVRRVAQQFAYSFPAEQWGMKSADASRPLSGDVVARVVDGALLGYRVVPALPSPAQLTLTGQHFVAVEPMNHLGVSVEPETPPVPTPETPPIIVPPVVTPPSVDVRALLDAFAQMQETIAALAAKLDALAERPLPAIDFASVPWPSFSSRLMGQRFTLTPCGGSTGRGC